jgi:hypothetical protein
MNTRDEVPFGLTCAFDCWRASAAPEPLSTGRCAVASGRFGRIIYLLDAN